MIYLLPLWVVLVFGLPDLQRLDYVSAGEVARRALAASSFALVRDRDRDGPAALEPARAVNLRLCRPPVR